MNTKQYLGMSGQFSLAKLLNILVILSMLLASCGTPIQHAASEKPAELPGKELAQNNYAPPVYTHPKPVIGERPEISRDSTEQVVQKLPIQFIENVGQFDKRALYQAQAGRQTTFITRDAIWLTILEENDDTTARASTDPANPEIRLPEELFSQQEKQTIKGTNLKLTFMEINTGMTVEGFIPLYTATSFLSGIEEQSFHTNVPVWGSIRYKNIFSGFDLEMEGENGEFAWKFVENADQENGLSDVRLKVEGAKSLALRDNGVLISTEAAYILIPLPSYDGQQAGEVHIEGNEIVLSFARSVSLLSGEKGFITADVAYSGGGALVVPASASGTQITNTNPLSTSDHGYITILQNGGGSAVFSAVDMYGNVFITGTTSGFPFPTLPGSFDTLPNGSWDVFVSRLSTTGAQLLYSTYSCSEKFFPKSRKIL